MEGVDAGYLYLETPTMHMHTLKIAIVEPKEQPFDLDHLTAEILARLEQLHALPSPRAAAPVAAEPSLVARPTGASSSRTTCSTTRCRPRAG